MSGPRKPGDESKFVIGANRLKKAAAPAPAKPPVIKVGINRHLGADERRAAFEQQQKLAADRAEAERQEAAKADAARAVAAKAAANEEEDRRLLDAAAKVTKASIFTRGYGPKDISASPGDDKKSGPKLGGR